MERSGKINAAGGFLRAVGERQAGAQGAPDTATLPVAQVLVALAEAAQPDSEGVGIDELAAELHLSRVVLAETLSNLSDLELVKLIQGERQERVLLTELGAVVAEKQRARSVGG
jgi:DNA-binding MarR family transcriptional regulator